jgi:hypothetical protein
LWFVQLEPGSRGVRASLVADAVFSLPEDPERLLKKAGDIYATQLVLMRAVVSDIHELRKARRHVPARKMWQLGDLVFRLRDAFAKHSLQLDDLYHHLTRDLGVKRKWLEKAIILRRYLPQQKMIPLSLNWGRCEKGTRRIARDLAARHHSRLG